MKKEIVYNIWTVIKVFNVEEINQLMGDPTETLFRITVGGPKQTLFRFMFLIKEVDYV